MFKTVHSDHSNNYLAATFTGNNNASVDYSAAVSSY